MTNYDRYCVHATESELLRIANGDYESQWKRAARREYGVRIGSTNPDAYADRFDYSEE